MKGQKTGGRTVGTPNKRTSAEQTIFEALAGPKGELYDQKLHEIASGAHGDHHARLKAIQIIAPYLWRKLPEAHEHSGPGGGPMQMTTVVHEHHSTKS